jgi:hypothetical protein
MTRTPAGQGRSDPDDDADEKAQPILVLFFVPALDQDQESVVARDSSLSLRESGTPRRRHETAEGGRRR